MKSLKEKAIIATLVVLVLYALTGFYAFKQLTDKTSSWAKSRKAYDRAVKTYRDECRLIAEKQDWVQAYEDEKAAMPTFEAGKATDTTWQRKMDELAAKHHIMISQRQAGKETEAGEVLELPIEVRSWEGALEPLVRFLHELENTDDGMFDIRTISFKPSSKRGYLKGSFTLTCAYMREK